MTSEPNLIDGCAKDDAHASDGASERGILARAAEIVLATNSPPRRELTNGPLAQA